MNRDAALPARRLGPGASLAEAQPWLTEPVTLDSPALDVMTDLTKVKAASTSPSTTLRQAEQLMIYQGVRMLFVVTDMPSVEGLITSNDVRGDKQMRVGQQRNLRYDELVVSDVMTSLSMVEAIEFGTMRFACVGNLVATLKKYGRNHLLVIETTAEAPQRIRGVVSRAQIERQLGSTIDITEIANSFAEIGQMLA